MTAGTTGGNGEVNAALIVVDFQEDFCPPNGSLAVPEGRDIAPTVNALLAKPFRLRLATRDWHPQDHISFAANHEGKAPFTSSVTIEHPHDPTRTFESTLWPVHCVQGTNGAELAAELGGTAAFHDVIDKGLDARVEMYSAFEDPFRLSTSRLEWTLREAGVTDVYVVGLSFDYCVKATAAHAAERGFRTYVVREGTRAVSAEGWDAAEAELRGLGVEVVGVGDEVVARIGL